ncbi:amphiphysin isoform X3 [Epinephelus lanceolatus]
MAEIKTGIFAKNVQKRLNRAQEKVLQKLGKADETKDEQFEQVVINFRRQESEGSRLQREMKAYMSAIKGMQQASINLTQSLHEVYEPDWHGKDDVMVIGKDCDALWEDFHNKLVDSTLLDLDAYLQQFPDLKTRVAKRSRKLIDYDSARHHVETLQMSGMKNDRKITKVSLVICDETWISYSSCYLWCVQVLRGGQFVNQTCFCLKAEEELKKAQKVFDELNVGLQDELPTLWDSRVGFYITTFKSVTHLETKFHREISLVCRQLYEVMTKLSEQHSDKMFTIQGAPSDSGPLRLARTPSPPEDESPPDSPDFSSNHMLRPVSPGPPRPKSPTQLKKGPPVPPPPKVTPTKEVAEEQIIDLFGGEFLPAPSPSQPNERPGESLLDLDFDAFQPDDSVSPIPQTAVPWDMWSANTQTAEPAADAGFVADWSADFGSLSANGDAASGAEAPAVGLERAQGGAQGGAQGRPQADDWQPGADTATTHPQDSEPTTAAQDEVSSWNSQSNPDLHPSAVRGDEDETRHADSVGDTAGQEDRRKSTPGLIFTNEYGEQIEDSTEDRVDKWSRSPDGSGSEYETAEEWGDGGQGGGWASADDELSYEDRSPVNVSEGWGSENNGVAADWSQMVGNISPESNAADRKCSGEEKPTGNQTDVTSSCRKYSESRGEGHKSIFKSETQGGGVFDSVTSAETQGAGAFDSVTSAETQGGGTFDLDPFAETQGGGAFDLDPFAETQEGGAFDSDPFVEAQEGGAFDSVPSAETQGGGVFDSDPFAETQRGGVFDSDPFAEEQGGGAFDSDPFAETQEGGAFDSVPSAETQGGGAFDSDPFAEAQGGGAFDSVPSAETQGGGAFDSDPFAEAQEGGAFDSDPFAETQVGGAFDSVPSAETQGGGAFDSDPFAETQEGGAFDSVPSAETQGGGAFDSDPFAETQEGGAFDSVPSAETQGGGAFDSDPFAETQEGGAFDSVPSAETQGGGAFDSDPFAETQEGGAFDSVPSAETQGGGAFDSDPFAETQGGGAFDSDPFAETQEGGAFDSVPSAETQGGGAFDSDPFAETQGGGAFDSDPFAETQGGGVFDSDPFAEAQGGGAFDSDPFAETQVGGAFDSVPSAETQGGGAFDSDRFAETQGGGAFDLVPSAERQGGDKGGGFEFEPFTETSGEDRVGSAVNARGGWDTDLFASSFPEAFAGTEGSHSSGFDSSVTQQNSASAAVSGTAEAIKDVNVTRIHKEPENSDMSEDEAANRRFGKLYQELDTEKEEVTNTFNGFSQDATVPSFFADFDKMNEVTAETTEAPEALDTEVSEEQDKPAALPAGEEPTASSAGEEPTASSVGEEPTASPAGEEPTALSAGDEEEEEPKAGAEPPSSPAGKQIEEPPGLSVGDQDTGSSVSVTEKKSDIPPVDEAKPSPDEAAPSEKMPIPSVVIEPASSNEGDDDRDADIISPTAISDNGVTAGNQPIKHMSPSGGVSGLPDDFLYKVETMHDFEAANSDELELKRGDIVLVVPTASVEDQDAGWLTGIKESDWLTLGAGAHKGLFPENFTQCLE